MKVTEVTIKGPDQITILLAVLSLIGGLFTSISSFVAVFVHKLTHS